MSLPAKLSNGYENILQEIVMNKFRTFVALLIQLTTVLFIFYGYVIKPSYGVSQHAGRATSSTPNPEKLVDGNITPYSMWGAGASGWWQYDFGEGTSKTLVQYVMYGWDASNNGPNAWTFEGSNDNATWAVLDAHKDVVWKDNTSKRFLIAKPSSYRYYKLNITGSVSGHEARLMELEMLDYDSLIINYLH